MSTIVLAAGLCVKVTEPEGLQLSVAVLPAA